MYDTDVATSRIVDGIRRWAAMESPSNRPEHVEQLVSHVAEHLASLGAVCERIDLGSGCARPVIARFNQQETPQPKRVLILGHLDTVHPIGSVNGPMPIHIEDGKLFGPGVLDMKGGVYLAVDALEQLVRSGDFPGCPVTVLLCTAVTNWAIGAPA